MTAIKPQESTGEPLRRRRRWRVPVLSLVLTLTLMALLLGLAGLALTGRSLPLPVWVVAEIEDRLNDRLGGTHFPAGASLSVGRIDVGLDRNLTPRLDLRDLRLLDVQGASVVALPELAVALDGPSLLGGEARPRSVRLLGAHLEARRDRDGRLRLSIGGLSGAPQAQGLGEVLDALDRMFSSPALAGLQKVEADALTLTLTDDRAGRVWELGDGRLVLENRPDGLAADLGLTLLDGRNPTQARLTVETDKASSAARILANLDGMAAADLAAQAQALAVLGLLDAPISGRVLGALDAEGKLDGFEAQLSLGAGAVRPSDTARPVAFDRAEMALRYDPARQRITLGSLRLESASVRLRARGSAELQGVAGALAAPGQAPGAVVAQLAFTDVMVDPDGVFAEPVRFGTGALDFRVTLRPFRIEIGQLALGTGADQLRLSGVLSAAQAGWSGSLDVALGRIDADRLVKLWPVSVVPKTRDWLAANVGQAQFLDLNAGLRFSPGQDPQFALDYDFSEAEVRFIRTLPPITGGRGRATIIGHTYTVVLEEGHVIAPNGGRIEADGSVMTVHDIRQFPADAEVRLVTRSGLTAALSLLDQEPFRFLTRAGRPVDLGQGTAWLHSTLRFPLKARIGVDDVDYEVKGRVRDFSSTVLVKGRKLEVPDMAVTVLPEGLVLAGKGTLDGLSFDARLDQPFGPEAAGRADLTADVRLSDKALRRFGIALPQGWLTGETSARVSMELPKAGPIRMQMTSSLKGAALSVPPLSWRKGKDSGARLDLTAILGTRPEVETFRLTAPGLTAAGSLTTRDAGALDEIRLTTLQAGDWLDATARLTGRGPGRSVGVEIMDGSLDLRRMPQGENGGDDAGERSEIKVSLDQLIVSSGITLTGFQGAFLARDGGIDGTFSAAVNGQGQVNGAVVPDRGRTAVRVTSGNAGTVMAAAGIFDKGRGGALDLTLSPRGPEGNYAGFATFSDLSVQDAPTLAALLGAVSVVGLLEQMSGSGIVFDEGDVDFVLSPSGVQIRRGTAVGLSLGLSFEGAYSSATGRLDLQGVVSPIYILNGLGQIFVRKGEGLFGFNYRLTGTADAPTVSVNPLSILTPGMFRDIFRRPPPQIRDNG